MDSRGVPWECAGARGVRFAELPPDIARSLPRWIETARVDEGTDLKAGRVWRVGEWTIKRFEPDGFVDRWLRASPALRSARLCARIAPVRTPRPLFALQDRPLGWTSAWLATEYVAGEHLHEALRSSADAVDALPAFMATMHSHDVLHGDLNVWNLLWNGREWVLIDLDGIRGPLHRFRRRAIADEQWARLAGTLRDVEFAKPLFDRYLEAMDESAQSAARWSRIESRARAQATHYDRLLAERATRNGA
jgi:tRNA A-37 threonylcarbamoyl transferase component Bud32